MSAVLRDDTTHATITTAASAARRRVAASNAATGAFFSANAEGIARACQAMAARFQRGGRLLVHGDAARQSDVAHVVVEFLHPVVVGKRALPAIAVATPEAMATLGREADILLTFADESGEAPVLVEARRRGMLTLCLAGEGTSGGAEFHFAVPSADACIVQEIHEQLYHVLWELVHVFLEHRPVSA